jgi:hypothetical protein
MLFQGLVAPTTVFPGGAKGCFDGERYLRSDFGLDLRPVFCWPPAQPTEQEQHNRRRSIRRGPRRKLFLGGSDPTLSGLAAAQRLPSPGVATAQVNQHPPRSVASRAAAKAVKNSESHQ